MKNIFFKIKVWWFWATEIRAYPVSDEWSEELKKLIESGCEFDIINEHYANFGPHKLWIANCPYASFSKEVKIREQYYAFLPNKEVAYLLVRLLEKAARKQLLAASKLAGQ